jgi:hypothetical protein
MIAADEAIDQLYSKFGDAYEDMPELAALDAERNSVTGNGDSADGTSSVAKSAARPRGGLPTRDGQLVEPWSITVQLPIVPAGPSATVPTG